MTTLFLTHAACLEHENGPGHPERPDRLRAVWRALEAQPFAYLVRDDAPQATIAQLSRAHPERYVMRMLELNPEPGERFMLDPDTGVGAGSIAAALHAAGAGIAAVDAVMAGTSRNAFCAVRPPGHHAESATPMGFCLFSNAAVAAWHAREAWGVQRVAVLDFDVHHGNGSQAILQDDPDFFYASSHEMPLYPGTGDPSKTGVANNVVNVALASGSGGEAFLAAWADVILPAMEAFAPGLVIISAGFDAHRRDPLANLLVEATDFAAVTRAICAVAGRVAGGRVVSLLEGGYDLEGLAASAAAHVRALME